MLALPDPPGLTEEEKTAQRETRDDLVRCAMLAVDMFAVKHAMDAPNMTRASWNRLLVEAAIGFLLSEGLIEATPQTEERFLRIGIPEHLMPDADSAVASAAALRRQVMRQ